MIRLVWQQNLSPQLVEDGSRELRFPENSLGSQKNRCDRGNKFLKQEVTEDQLTGQGRPLGVGSIEFGEGWTWEVKEIWKRKMTPDFST